MGEESGSGMAVFSFLFSCGGEGSSDKKLAGKAVRMRVDQANKVDLEGLFFY